MNVQQQGHVPMAAPSAGMENLHLRDTQGGAAPQAEVSPHGTSLAGTQQRRLGEHNDYEEGLLRSAHEKKRAAEAEAFLVAEKKKAEALVNRKAADAEAEVRLAAAKAAEKEAKIKYKMDLKVDKAHEKYEKKAAVAVEQAELKKAAVQEEAEEKVVAAMERAEHVRAGEEVLKPTLAQKIGLKKKDF